MSRMISANILRSAAMIIAAKPEVSSYASNESWVDENNSEAGFGSEASS